MKRLLTFTYGLINIGFGLFLVYSWDITIEWYRWIAIVFGAVIMHDGWVKLDKAIE